MATAQHETGYQTQIVHPATLRQLFVEKVCAAAQSTDIIQPRQTPCRVEFVTQIADSALDQLTTSAQNAGQEHIFTTAVALMSARQGKPPIHIHVTSARTQVLARLAHRSNAVHVKIYAGT